jgi:predicted transcriptional regulator
VYDRFIFSGIHREIIVFFSQNPACIDTAQGIAVWINKDVSQVRKALTDLVKNNILIAHKVTSMTGYSFSQDEELKRTLKKGLSRYGRKVEKK